MSARLSRSYCLANGLESTVRVIQKHADELNAEDLEDQKVCFFAFLHANRVRQTHGTDVTA